MSKGSGVALILIGSYTETLAAKLIYVALLIVIMVGLGFYVKLKCTKTPETKDKISKKNK